MNMKSMQKQNYNSFLGEILFSNKKETKEESFFKSIEN